MDALLLDLRYALRQMRRSPLFTATSIVTLAIGIGATTAIFSTVNATLLRPLPYRHPEELVSVRTRLSGGRITTGLLSPVELTALGAPNLPIVRVAGLSNQPFDATLISPDGTPTQVLLTSATEGFFELLGLPMARGRGFIHEEEINPGPGAPLFVVLSYRAWRTMFGGDPAIVGKTVRFAEVDAPTTVVGVASPSLDMPHDTDFWVNFRLNPLDVWHGIDAVVRVPPGTRIEKVRSELSVVMAGLARTTASDEGREYVVRPLVTAMVGDLGPTLLLILGAAGLLLLLACVNVANLLLARGTARMREMATRAALGASRRRVVRQLVTEAAVLATAGAVAGLGLAWGAVRILLAFGASKLPRLDRVPFDGRVLLFAFCVLLFAAVVMGAAPAWRLAKTDIRGLLNDGGRSATAGRGASRLMSALIVGEIALAIALVAGAGWLVQSFARLERTDPGFTAAGRLVVDVRPTKIINAPVDGLAWSHALMQHIRDTAGVALAGAASTLPLRADRDPSGTVEIRGELSDPNHPVGAHMRIVTPGFFAAMGIRLLEGRAFTVDDRQQTAPVAVVNRAFVRRFIGGRDPMAAQFTFGYPKTDPQSLRSIVGVVDDVRYVSLGEQAEPIFYVSQDQVPYPFTRHAVVVTAQHGDAEALIPAIRFALKRFDPQLVVAFAPASAIVAATLERQSLGMALLVIFGATALTLAAVGIYGVIAYAVAEREAEVATRLAVGASPRDVFRLMMSTGQRLAVAGIALGLTIAYAVGRVVAASVYGMRPDDPIVLAGAAALVCAVTILAIAIPAHRASRLSPSLALRSK
ncbi:MAG TPA: ABC transporter permease [Vicinamibacterales bacterium]|nr:ABC transporter permease [Vicinamibacterales bacterium]